MACAAGAAGGGAVVGLRVAGVGDLPVAVPFLTLATLLAGYATFSGEKGRGRELVLQGATQALVTALLSTVGLTAFYLLLPVLTPGGGKDVAWLALIIFLAALPLEPLRMLLVERASRALFRRATTVPELAASVEASEARADQAERLAELGRVVSAVAHEIRNPLGVIAAQAKLLERRGADPGRIADVRAQVERARLFLDDLLRYGKPRPLDPRRFDVAPLIELTVANVRQAFGPDAPAVAVTVAGSSGVPTELLTTLFERFVTGRGRDAKHPGTGLGLAIAARWVERHGGTIAHERVSAAGGARFVVRWPHEVA